MTNKFLESSTFTPIPIDHNDDEFTLKNKLMELSTYILAMSGDQQRTQDVVMDNIVGNPTGGTTDGDGGTAVEGSQYLYGVPAKKIHEGMQEIPAGYQIIPISEYVPNGLTFIRYSQGLDDWDFNQYQTFLYGDFGTNLLLDSLDVVAETWNGGAGVTWDMEAGKTYRITLRYEVDISYFGQYEDTFAQIIDFGPLNDGLTIVGEQLSFTVGDVISGVQTLVAVLEVKSNSGSTRTQNGIALRFGEATPYSAGGVNFVGRMYVDSFEVLGDASQGFLWGMNATRLLEVEPWFTGVLDVVRTINSAWEIPFLHFDAANTDLFANTVQSAIEELDLKKADLSDLSSNILQYATNTVDVGTGYYTFTDSVDDPSYNDTPVDLNVTITDTESELLQFITDTNLYEGDAGVILTTISAQVREISGIRPVKFRYEVYHRSGGVETLIGTSGWTRDINTGTYVAGQASALLSEVDMALTDQMVVKIFGVKTIGGGGDVTAQFQLGGAIPFKFSIPVPVNVVAAKDASAIVTDTTNFDRVLDSNDSTVQQALDKLDNTVWSTATLTALSQLTKDINFDERYYTETEIDTALTGKANLAGDTFTGNVIIGSAAAIHFHNADSAERMRSRAAAGKWYLAPNNNDGTDSWQWAKEFGYSYADASWFFDQTPFIGETNKWKVLHEGNTDLLQSYFTAGAWRHYHFERAYAPSTYFETGEYLVLFHWEPLGVSRNVSLSGEVIVSAGSTYSVLKFTAGLRSDTLPANSWDVRYASEGDPIDCKLVVWDNETTGAIKILVKNVAGGSLHNVHTKFVAYCRADYRSDIQSVPDTELTTVDAGFTETILDPLSYWPERGQWTLDAGLVGDAILTVRADRDNNAENDHPSVRFKQDGDLVDYRLGIGLNDNDSAATTSNAFHITAMTATTDQGLYWSPDNTNSYEIWNSGNFDPASKVSRDTTAYTTGLDGRETTMRRYNPEAGTFNSRHNAVITYGNESNVVGQIATDFVTGETSIRAYNTAWSVWRTLWDSENFDPNSQTITGDGRNLLLKSVSNAPATGVGIAFSDHSATTNTQTGYLDGQHSDGAGAGSYNFHFRSTEPKTSLHVDENEVWHAGNFDPDAKAPAVGYVVNVNLTGQAQSNDYRKTVIALCELTNTNASYSSWWGGTIGFHRSNSLAAEIAARVQVAKKYNTTKPNAWLRIDCNTLVTTPELCTFTYGGVKYAGIHFFYSNARHEYVVAKGYGNFTPFAVDYYNTQTATAIDTEINNSLSFDDFASASQGMTLHRGDFDPDNATSLKVTGSAWNTHSFVIEGSSPNVSLQETDGPWWQLGSNNGTFYILNDAAGDGSYDGPPYPFSLNSSNAYVNGNVVWHDGNHYSNAEIDALIAGGGIDLAADYTWTGLHKFVQVHSNDRFELYNADYSTLYTQLLPNYFQMNSPADVTKWAGINVQNATSHTLSLFSKTAMRGDGSWLRINDLGNFASGIYTGSSRIRTDNSLEVGSNGSTFLVNSTNLTYKGNPIAVIGQAPTVIFENATSPPLFYDMTGQGTGWYRVYFLGYVTSVLSAVKVGTFFFDADESAGYTADANFNAGTFLSSTYSSSFAYNIIVDGSSDLLEVVQEHGNGSNGKQYIYKVVKI